MLNSNLLYFPNINVPDSAWTYRSLLYYDTIRSIVPEEYHRGKAYEPFMQQLVDQHLVIPIDPMQTAGSIPQEVHDEVLKYIELAQYNIETKRTAFRKARSQYAYMPTLVSREKFLYSLIRKLEDAGLAVLTHDKFYDIEPNIAKLMMLLLTNKISNNLGLNPVTDNCANIGVRLSSQTGAQAPEVSRRRRQVLDGILPGPEFIDLNKILDFKVKYGNELRKFRFLVEEISLDDKFDNSALLDNKVAHINDLREELTARMTEDNFGKLGRMAYHLVSDAAMAALAFDFAGVVGMGKSVKDRIEDWKTDLEQLYEPTGIKYLALVYKHL